MGLKQLRLLVLAIFVVLSGASVWYGLQLKFAFSLDQFFPEGDPDLAFFENFVEEFDNDVNFLLVAFTEEETVFKQPFLQKVHEFTLAARRLPQVKESQSLTRLDYPVKTPFGITTIPVIHLDQPERYPSDSARIMQDDRFVNQFISEDGRALVVGLRTNGKIQLEESQALIRGVDSLVYHLGLESYHVLGPAYFQKEMVAMQQRELMVSTVVSGLLVSLIMFFLFRRPWGIGIALFSIALGMLLFLGLLGVWGRPLNAMAALYPVLMIIVGTSDIIHIMSKYIDELRKGFRRREAIFTTIREIGMATLLTSLTTAAGFASLVTSRIIPIRDFGLNAAVGVLTAYITVIFFSTAVLSWFREHQLIRLEKGFQFWEAWMARMYQFTLERPRAIIAGAVAVLLLSFWGISMITTNYRIESNLPRGAKVTQDFLFFENEMAGFRPMEIAVFAQGENRVDDYRVMAQMNRLEQFMDSLRVVKNITSATTLVKSVNQMNHRNDPDYYLFPDDEGTFSRYQRLINKLPNQQSTVFLNEDKTKARISTRVLDVGADSIKAIGQRIDNWIAANTDSSLVTFKRTGTGLILDKNSEYVRDSLLKGLGLAILIVSLLMALLFRNVKMVFISLVPNTLPLLLAGAMLGFMGIELEAGISIVFAVVFGIAVDDTIHFLSKYKLTRDKGKSVEESLRITFLETGKAICLTTVILFFGFLVMLFSIHPPSVTVGSLISLTLFSALFGDLLLIPILIRWLLK